MTRFEILSFYALNIKLMFLPEMDYWPNKNYHLPLYNWKVWFQQLLSDPVKATSGSLMPFNDHGFVGMVYSELGSLPVVFSFICEYKQGPCRAKIGIPLVVSLHFILLSTPLPTPSTPNTTTCDTITCTKSYPKQVIFWAPETYTPTR